MTKWLNGAACLSTLPLCHSATLPLLPRCSPVVRHRTGDQSVAVEKEDLAGEFARPAAVDEDHAAHADGEVHGREASGVWGRGVGGQCAAEVGADGGLAAEGVVIGSVEAGDEGRGMFDVVVVAGHDRVEVAGVPRGVPALGEGAGTGWREGGRD